MAVRRPGMPVPRSGRFGVRSGFPAGRRPVSKNHAVDGLIDLPYEIPNRSVGCVLKNTHVPVMCWRGVGLTQNLFAVESFIDELAHLAGQDPYKYRRALLAGRPDYVRILDLVAQRSGWDKPLEKGRG